MCDESERGRVHYLPHSWIFQKNKLRVVFDASAKTKSGESLNDQIHAGPNLVENSIGILINVRLGAVALSADIEKAFLQMVLNELDRDCTRFLWIKDINKPLSKTNLLYFRFARILFGVNASPFLLNMVIKDLLSSKPHLKILIQNLRNFYVDNFITSVDDLAEALQIFEILCKELRSIKMNLRDWVSNEERVIRALPADSRLENSNVVTLLGIEWHTKQDVLCCKLNSNLPTLGTKHNILSFLASVYDPLGFFSPCLLELKLFLRECWRVKYQWHQQLSDEMVAIWIKLRSEILQIEKIPIPRHIGLKIKRTTYSIHIFCDASQKAYACCAYLICTDKITSAVISNLIFAKVRLAPKNALSIPKLELLGVLIGKRTAEFLINNFRYPIDQTIVWTDATTVLQWLHSMEILPPFVQNRITEIRKSAIDQIRYVPTEDNPADYASRGKTPSALKQLEKWWNGPSWVVFPKSWPSPPENVLTFEPKLEQRRQGEFITTLVVSEQIVKDPTLEELEKKFELGTWSAKVKLFKYVVRSALYKENPNFEEPPANEMFKLCEKFLILSLQQKYFKTEYELLKRNKVASKNLDLFLDDDNIIRCRSRLTLCNLPKETIKPILLPREDSATAGYIREIHQKNGHVGANHVLAKLRERFWVIKGRSLVKSVLKRCVTCRRWTGGSYELPPIPPLPEIRVTTVAPFLFVGTDYIGPFFVKNNLGQTISVQILVFVCLVTRAVHLELVPDLTGYNCYLALLRFTTTRRVPHVIISDNASTFQFVQPIVGNNIVQLKDYRVKAFATSNNINWHFIPAYAPWFGGAYERLNGLIKSSLKKSYGLQLLHYEEFRTAIAVASDIVNSRPLTYVSDEPIQILTPNHFLKLGPTNINTDLGEPISKPPVSDTGAQLKQNWRYVSQVLDAYWESFKHDYLVSLLEKHRRTHPRKRGTSRFTPSVGDIVLIEEPHAPRADWTIGTITKLDRRQALAYVRNNNKIIMRSIRQLYPLEVACERNDTLDTAQNIPSTSKTVSANINSPQIVAQNSEPPIRLAITAGP
ncbi:uncharacterized protein LOC135840339 isoform X2 [Planococcus citri]|uniref:uncharacterized protein LOC135840339 isoform X2 n=1 Tax=Planococcus citri TaxID=170843 RepID=UPI0031F83A2B